MSQTLLFSIGVVVFAITVVATLLYGYFALDRIYQADAAERPVMEEPAHQPMPDVAVAAPLLIPSPAAALD